jgi:hypothetical protein
MTEPTKAHTFEQNITFPICPHIFEKDTIIIRLIQQKHNRLRKKIHLTIRHIQQNHTHAFDYFLLIKKLR